VSAGAWKTGHREGGCAACEAGFEPGTIVVSTLHAAPDDEDVPFVRRDFCGGCFDGEADTGEPFSWWRAEVPAPEEKKAAFDLGVAREFLVRLLQEDAPERASLRYLLALLLMRKRIVRVDDQFTDERGEMMTIRLPPDEAVHEISCPEIDEGEAEALRDQIGRLFDLGDGSTESSSDSA
jgi:hypothetical protein